MAKIRTAIWRGIDSRWARSPTPTFARPHIANRARKLATAPSRNCRGSKRDATSKSKATTTTTTTTRQHRAVLAKSNVEEVEVVAEEEVEEVEVEAAAAVEAANVAAAAAVAEAAMRNVLAGNKQQWFDQNLAVYWFIFC
jgi:hypothetical protein